MPVGKEYTEQSILVNKKMQFELGQDLVFVIVVMKVQIPHQLGISPTVELL
jgi:hypothetical protein